MYSAGLLLLPMLSWDISGLGRTSLETIELEHTLALGQGSSFAHDKCNFGKEGSSTDVSSTIPKKAHACSILNMNINFILFYFIDFIFIFKFFYSEYVLIPAVCRRPTIAPMQRLGNTQQQ